VDKRHKSNSRADLRLCAAMIGGSAVLAMAAVGLMVAHEHDGYAVDKSSSMSIGSPAVAVAKPIVNGPAPLISDQEAAK
jgi:hypothetical protein